MEKYINKIFQGSEIYFQQSHENSVGKCKLRHVLSADI